MDLQFYKQAATPERVDKSGFLTSMGTISNVVIKDTDEMMTPTFILKTDQLVYNSNYVYCNFTSRYYYITSIDVLTGGRIAINCKVDVLFTYKNEILHSSAWVLSSSSASDAADYDMLHNDYPFQADYEIMGADLSASSPLNPDQITGAKNIYMAIK